MASATIVAARYMKDGKEWATAITFYNVPASLRDDERWFAHAQRKLRGDLRTSLGYLPEDLTFEVFTTNIPEEEE